MRRLRCPYAVLAVGCALSGCTAGDDGPVRTPAPASPTPLSAFDASGLAVARADFCAAVPDDAVAAALGGPATTSTSYGEGEPAALAPGVRDRSGEFDCTWTADDGTVARAWVFAPPITRERAGRLVRAVGAQRGCRPVEAPAYGDPSVATVCRAAGGVRTAAYAGLFGDAWLSCSVSGPAPVVDLRERAGRWCVAVAGAAAG